MPSSTLKKFGYPDSVIKSYSHWYLLLRPLQSVFGSMVLVCKESVQHYSKISASAMCEQKKIIYEIEAVLESRFDCRKVNYMMLMMTDPAVHFHVIPRYEFPVEFCEKKFLDHHWPGMPDLAADLQLDPVYQSELLRMLVADFSCYDVQDSPTTKKYKRIYTSGCFDIFHQGHLNILKKSKELCEYLVVGVSTDELIVESKGRPPIIPFEERISILEANRYVDEAIPQVDKNKQAVVDQHHIDAISVGSDWRGKYPSVTCDMVYFDYTPNVSSTVLKQRLGITT